MYEQLTLFPIPEPEDTRPPVPVMWNLWHGCTKASAGCKNCYMYRRDESVGRDPSVVEKTNNFDLPVRRLRSGKYKGMYKVPAGSNINTCFSSDFFHAAADEWRDDAWDMIRKRDDCTFFMITKRPERIGDHLPKDWEDGWEHVTIAVTCENQAMLEKRLSVYIDLPIPHRSVMIEPMLSAVDLRPFLEKYPGSIELVTVGGESGPNARACEFDWVRDVYRQCMEAGVLFYYHQTGARLIKDGEEIYIPRREQHWKARRMMQILEEKSEGFEVK